MYKLYNISVWAVECHLGRDKDKTIEKVSSRFYWRNNSKSGNEYQEGTGKDKLYWIDIQSM